MSSTRCADCMCEDPFFGRMTDDQDDKEQELFRQIADVMKIQKQEVAATIIYDIRNQENAQRTLEALTGISFEQWNVESYRIRDYTYEDY